MFELRLQFYQRNDINLKALRGLSYPPQRQKRVKGGLKRERQDQKPDDNQRSLFMEK